jgi:hypothetical protein
LNVYQTQTLTFSLLTKFFKDTYIALFLFVTNYLY